MAETRNLCAQIPVDLHAKVIEEKNALGQALSEYITNILKEHFEGGNKTMANGNMKTLAFQIPEELDFASIDVSFISLKLILPAVCGLLKDGGHVACLVKPQFEAGKEKVGKKGVVRDPAVHLEVLENFLAHAKESGFTVLDITFSPIRGPEGNIEFLGHLTLSDKPGIEPDTAAVVAAAHEALRG